MIVLSDPGDEAVGAQFQQRLHDSEWRRFLSDIAPLESVPERVKTCSADLPLFAVGMTMERLALTIVGLRTFTVNPIIAVSHGGSVAEIVRLMRVGATDILDLDGCFETQMRAIFQNSFPQHCKLADRPVQFPGLSKAQHRVASLLLGDLSEKEIAEKLGRSYFTIHNHIKEIYRKCNIRSRRQFINAHMKSPPPSIPLAERARIVAAVKPAHRTEAPLPADSSLAPLNVSSESDRRLEAALRFLDRMAPDFASISREHRKLVHESRALIAKFRACRDAMRRDFLSSTRNAENATI